MSKKPGRSFRAGDYNKVLQLVKKGFTIQKACFHFGLTTPTFYKGITAVQKLEIKQERIAFSKYGKGSAHHIPDLRTVDIEEDEDYIQI